MTKSEQRKMTIHPKGNHNVLGAIPWVAVAPEGVHNSTFCEATTRSGSDCARKVKYIYFAVTGRMYMMCLSHTSAALNRAEEQPRLEQWKDEVDLEEMVVCSDHRPVQYRDGKPPWCPKCGLTKHGKVPVSRIKLEEK